LRSSLDLDVIAAAVKPASLDRVKVKAAPGWMRRLWLGPVSAMTLPGGIYMRTEVLTGDPAILGPLLFHELIHSRQWLELGVVRFLFRYLSGYLRGRLQRKGHRQAYLDIPLEQQARQIAGV
jgi:hypothetical protein